MWLLDTETYALKHLQEDEACEAGYAILSHTWGYDEITFQGVRDLENARRQKAWFKIEKLCTQAQTEGLRYAWIDTCCIDKSSSAELSEAINSMFRWYNKASICYAYLEDVSEDCAHALRGLYDSTCFPNRDEQLKRLQRKLASSRWFTRGWTLQELLAPCCVRFYGGSWAYVGTYGRERSTIEEFGWHHIPATQSEFVGMLESITDIPLSKDNLLQEPAARKMSWASYRDVTRPEDCAYSLMGLFDINMPLLYGEGSKKAFERLQLEILKSSGDLSLLLNDHWGGYSLFAETPYDFRFCGSLLNYQVFNSDWRHAAEAVLGPDFSVRMKIPTAINLTFMQNGKKRLSRAAAILNFRCSTDTLPVVVPFTQHDTFRLPVDDDTDLICSRNSYQRYPCIDPECIEDVQLRQVLLVNLRSASRLHPSIWMLDSRIWHADVQLSPWCDHFLSLAAVESIGFEVELTPGLQERRRWRGANLGSNQVNLGFTHDDNHIQLAMKRLDLSMLAPFIRCQCFLTRAGDNIQETTPNTSWTWLILDNNCHHLRTLSMDNGQEVIVEYQADTEMQEVFVGIRHSHEPQYGRFL